VLFAPSGEKIEERLYAFAITQSHKDWLKSIQILHTDDMKEAVRFAYQGTQIGKICLLSTASPSYSIWKNFEEKGDLFQKYIKELSKE
jgi:UDP-N-acetylmuramoylalanine--D-glutamate ligase